MKRTRVIKDDPLCACGHLECRKVVEQSITVMQKQLSKTKALLDTASAQQQHDQLKRVIDLLKESLSELRQRVNKLEDIKVTFSRSMAEYYKRELVNVRLKYTRPIMRNAFDQIEPPEGIHQKNNPKKRKLNKK